MIKIKNHLVILSQHFCGYITCFALWEIHPCLFSVVQNQTPQSQWRLSAEEPVYAWFVSCSFTQLSKRCRTHSDCSSSDTCDDLDSREVQMVLCYCFRQFSSVLCTLQSNYAGYVRHHEALGIQDFYALDGYLCDNSIHYILLWCGRMSFPDFKLVGAILSVCNDVKYARHYVTGDLSVGRDIHRSKQTMSVRKFAMSSMPIKIALFKA